MRKRLWQPLSYQQRRRLLLRAVGIAPLAWFANPQWTKPGPALLSLWHIGLPIARPTAIGVALLLFVLYWGDFISPLLMAGAVLATSIPIALFLLLQSYFTRLDQS